MKKTVCLSVCLFVSLFDLRSAVSTHGPPPPLLWLLGAEIAEDPPVAESEGVGHGVADVGPAEDSQGDPADRVEDCHDLGHGRLWGNVAVTCPEEMESWEYIFCA